MLRTLAFAAALCLTATAAAQPPTPAPDNQYLVLVYETPAEFAARTGPGAPAYWNKWSAYSDEMRAEVHVSGGGPLTAPVAARSVRARSGQSMITPGPYHRGAVQVSGYFLIEAPSLEAATAIAAKSPSVTSGGGVEVRPMAPAPTMTK